MSARPNLATPDVVAGDSPIRRARAIDYFLMAFTALLWAGAFIGVKVAVPALGPYGVALARAVIGLAVLLPVGVRYGLVRPEQGRDWTILAAIGTFSIAIPFSLISWAELHVDAGVAALLMGTGPLFALVGAHYLNAGDRMSGARFGGVLLGFAGIATLVGGEAFDAVRGAHLLANAALIGASLCYVASGLLVRRTTIPPLSLSVYALAFGALALLPLALAVPTGTGEFDMAVIVAVLFMGIFPTGVAYLLRFRLIRRVGYATFALSVNLVPVFGVLLGALILGEQVTPRLVLALVLVITGLVLARKGTA